MNRTDQASEPTMEDILASIRLIISDDAKKGPSGREEHPSRLAPPRPETAPLNALPEEDVLDLTDALVFPEDKPSPRAPGGMNEHHATPAAHYEEAAEAQQDAIGEASEAVQVADALPQPNETQPPAEPSQDHSRSAQPASRTIWSRRELPGSPPPVAPAAPRYEAPARQPQKNWAQDVQMPIPDRGPVSLIPDQAPAPVQEIADAKQTAEWEAESDAGLSDGLGEKGEAAVAAIAESLARSAANAMNSDELATAGDVDFSKLGEEQKAEVTETFANAIQSESRPRNNGPLPTLLDEVLRQDFRREPSPEGEAADDLYGSEASGAYEVSDKKAGKEDFGSMWGAPSMAFQSAASPEPAQRVRDEPLARAVQEKPAKTASPREADTASPAASGSPLENAVRDMLQPLLEQWLNEHMPRILESAIRGEIATRGLSPKAEK